MRQRIYLTAIALLLSNLAWADPAMIENRVVPTVQPSGNTIYTPVGSDAGNSAMSSNAGGVGLLFTKIEQMQSELQSLRGQVETLTFELEQVKQGQKDQYLDLDARLNKLSDSGASPATSVATGVTPELAADANSALNDNASALPQSSADPALEQAQYDAAFALLRQKNYPAADSAFTAFVRDYPDGKYADNAYYWLGETLYVQNKLPQARQAFDMVLSHFPNSGKASGAKLKVAYILSASGERDKAKALLKDLIKQDAGSATAKLAQKKLSELH